MHPDPNHSSEPRRNQMPVSITSLGADDQASYVPGWMPNPSRPEHGGRAQTLPATADRWSLRVRTLALVALLGVLTNTLVMAWTSFDIFELIALEFILTLHSAAALWLGRRHAIKRARRDADYLARQD